MSNVSVTGRSLYVVDEQGKTRVRIDVPGQGIIQAPAAAEETIHVDGHNGAITFKIGSQTRIVLRGFTTEGSFGGGATIGLRGLVGHETISLHADGANVTLRQSSTGNNTVVLDGDHASLSLGGLAANSPTGQINLLAGGQSRILLDSADANIYLGGNGKGGDLFLYPLGGSFMGGATKTAPSLALSGDKGDITLANADCAEEFDIADEEPVDPGTVMVMRADGKLGPSLEPYDRRVAGVVAGAAGHRPGIILGRQGTQAHRLPIGLLGRVSCKVDADYTPIAVGDLLTTSPTPGHAMKATDPSQAFGAVLGKAMAALPAGRELVPILIALQ